MRSFLAQYIRNDSREDELKSIGENLKHIDEQVGKILACMDTLLDADIEDGIQGMFNLHEIH